MNDEEFTNRWVARAVRRHHEHTKGFRYDLPVTVHQFLVTVVVNDDRPYNPGTLSSLEYDISQGDAIGEVEKLGQVSLKQYQVEPVLLELGNDGGFFEPLEEEVP